MSKIYKVGVVFEFDPKGEHDFLFEGMTKKEMIRSMISMVSEDLFRFSSSGEVERMIVVEEVEVKN